MRHEIEVLVDGLGLVESPRTDGGAVWFSDWTHGAVHRFDLSARRDEVIAEVASLPLCFDLDEGDLLVADARRHTLLRGREGSLQPWAALGDRSVGGENEVLATGRHVYVDTGNFDPAAGFPTEPVGRILHVDQDGLARSVAADLAFPNGMGVTPDGRTLIVAESYAGRLTSFTIETNGDLTGRRVWADLDGAAPDGIAVAADGSCWYAEVPGHRVVHVAEGGPGARADRSRPRRVLLRPVAGRREPLGHRCALAGWATALRPRAPLRRSAAVRPPLNSGTVLDGLATTASGRFAVGVDGAGSARPHAARAPWPH